MEAEQSREIQGVKRYHAAWSSFFWYESEHAALAATAAATADAAAASSLVFLSDSLLVGEWSVEILLPISLYLNAMTCI